MQTEEQAPGSSSLHARYPELEATLPHLMLGKPPSPVVPLERLSSRLGGPPLWLKNDGLYGSIYGSNKVRKLEFILADALRRGCRTIITFGGIGTNHGLATAIYGREQGLRTVLLLVDQPVDDHVRTQIWRFHQVGAIVHRTRNVPRTTVEAAIAMVRYADWRHGRLPYFLPTGGSSPLGAVGYVNAALELADQVAAGELPEPAEIFVTLGSGGTLAGLALGLRLAGLRTHLTAVLVTDVVPPTPNKVMRLANRSARLLRRRGAPLPEGDIDAQGVTILSDWVGAGYGYATPEAGRAEELLRDTEGLELDGVYTAKTMAALLHLVEAGEIKDGPVLYWHTYNALPLSFGEPTAYDLEQIPKAFRDIMSSNP